MDVREYEHLFHTWCELKGETVKSIHGSDVLNFNRDTRWMGMEIDLITRDVISSPANVAKATAIGEDDGDIYAIHVNLTFCEVYVVDSLGELIETFPMKVENGVFIGNMQNYLL